MRKLIRAVILTNLFLLVLISLSSQVSHGGKPRSFLKNLSLKSLNWEMQPYQNNTSLLEKEENSSGKEAGFQFGKEIEVNYTLENSGIWDTLVDGSRLWRLGIYSANAYSLNLLFDSFYIPSGSNLFIYTEDKSFVMGSFTEKNNNQWGNFATSLFPKDKIILEYYEPVQNKGLGIINLSIIVHGYKDFFFKQGTFGNASGKCHVNINCVEGDSFQSVKRAVALILRNGSAHCSGTLINNTAQDGTPYFLTANHCVTGRNLSTFVFIFNYESSDCDGNPEKTYYTYNGATLLASHENSDFALLLMNDTPTQEAMPYYAGWDRRDNTIAKAVSIHHPNGDLKKISVCNTLLGSTKWHDNDLSYPDNTHWKVTLWNKGSTEGGSSGAGLFNSFEQIIGTLEGGLAECIGNLPNDTSDWYGKVAYSWTNDNNVDSNRLDYWLDPLSIGVEVLNGYSPYNIDSVNIADYKKVENRIKIYPNPANDKLTIETDLEILSCSIYTINGQCINEISVNSSKNNIWLNAFPTGIYLVKIQTGQGLVYKKLIIQK